MAIKPPSPLIYNVPIVRTNGTPTNEFMRLWNQQAAINIDVVVITTAIEALESDVANLESDVADIQDVDVVAGVGLTGGGNIAGPTDITLDLEDTAVTPGTYGDATNSARITIDQQGRITGVTEEPISGGGGGGNTLKSLIYINSPKAVSSTAFYAVSFDAAQYDDANVWDVAEPTKFVIPAALDGKKVKISASAQASANFSAGSRWNMYVQRDTGSGFSADFPGAGGQYTDPDINSPYSGFSTGWIEVSEGDEFQVTVYSPDDTSYTLKDNLTWMMLEAEA